jgi:hypothetical protein
LGTEVRSEGTVVCKHVLLVTLSLCRDVLVAMVLEMINDIEVRHIAGLLLGLIAGLRFLRVLRLAYAIGLSDIGDLNLVLYCGCVALPRPAQCVGAVLNGARLPPQAAIVSLLHLLGREFDALGGRGLGEVTARLKRENLLQNLINLVLFPFLRWRNMQGVGGLFDHLGLTGRYYHTGFKHLLRWWWRYRVGLDWRFLHLDEDLLVHLWGSFGIIANYLRLANDP